MPSEYPTPDPARIRDHRTPAEPLAGMTWPAALHAALLDPALWRESLHTYARATHLAVALSDAQGDVLGECLNPQPTWLLLQAQTAVVCPPGCPFSLASRQPCPCIADALATGHVALVHDRMTRLGRLVVTL